MEERPSLRQVIIERRNVLIDKAKGECTDKKWPRFGTRVDLTREELDIILKSDLIYKHYGSVTVKKSHNCYFLTVGQEYPATTDGSFAVGGIIPNMNNGMNIKCPASPCVMPPDFSPTLDVDVIAQTLAQQISNSYMNGG